MSQITVIYLLYNASKSVRALVENVLRQRGEFEVIFMDDCSRDDTVATLKDELQKRGNPVRLRLEPNPKNLGLAGTLNRAFSLVKTPFALTCHCDAYFGREDYVQEMERLMLTHPNAGAITGQPAIPPVAKLPFAEKVNLIANLMDIFPTTDAGEITPIGFAEGRCDTFRIEALAQVGFYSTELRTSGEDQLLAARMRAQGYHIYQAPRLPYYLSVSDEQDTVRKLVKHQRLFARTHPYILLKGGTQEGAFGKEAGLNRRQRSLLRLTQLAFALLYPLILLGILLSLWLGGSALSLGLLSVGAILLGIIAVKWLLFRRHFKAVRLKPLEWLRFWAWQPALDVSYGLGFTHGLLLVLIRADMRTRS